MLALLEDVLHPKTSGNWVGSSTEQGERNSQLSGEGSGRSTSRSGLEQTDRGLQEGMAKVTLPGVFGHIESSLTVGEWSRQAKKWGKNKL